MGSQSQYLNINKTEIQSKIPKCEDVRIDIEKVNKYGTKERAKKG